MKNSDINTNVNRRNFLRSSVAGGAAALSATGITTQLAGCQNQTSNLSFKEIPHRLDHHHHIPEGYQAQTLLRWGDALFDETDFVAAELTAKSQALRFGYNNDFIGFMPLASTANDGSNGLQNFESNNSNRGLLCVNHEYTLPHLMFSGYSSEEDAEANTTLEHLAIEQQACGHSVVEIVLVDDQWRVNTNSHYNRRITLSTPMRLSGPAAGHPRLATSSDPSAQTVHGTVGNCAGGKTPWGTVLIAEEGFGSAFMGNINHLSEAEQDNYRRLSIGEGRPWGKYDSRFNIEQEPNEANRFGWMVEFDPYDPQSTPQKLTALGRFEHEGTTLVAKNGQPIVAYTGDDDEFQFIYKFVSSGIYDEHNPSDNRKLLEDGILYAAQLNEDGSGEWLALTHGQPFLTEKFGFHSQADILIECRRAAQMIGATPMDRPEDIETNPVNDCTYVMLTKNKKRNKSDPGNLRPNNTAGHILELLHPGQDGNRDHTALKFQWTTFLLGGHPHSGNHNDRGFYGKGPDGQSVTEDGWFATPDNLAFDNTGNMWVATDGCEAFHFHDGLWAMPTSGPYRAIPKHFFGCPLGAEICGPEFTPDGTTLFVSVQHPGDSDNSTFDQPVHRWPDFDDALPPRPSVLAIRRKDGASVGR